MGMTVFGGTLQRLLTCLRPAVLRFAVSLAVVCKLTACFSRESDASQGRAVFWRVLRPYSGKASFGRCMCSRR